MSQSFTSVTVTLRKLGKSKVGYFFFKINAQKTFCFHRVMVNCFQPISARIVSCLFYKFVYLSTLRVHSSFPSTEAAILLVSTKDRDLWPASTSKLANLIGWKYKTSTLRMLKKSGREVSILGADQKDFGLWGREWSAVLKTQKSCITSPQSLSSHRPFSRTFGGLSFQFHSFIGTCQSFP